MSSKKITDADKLEIVDLYRQSGDSTASLASRYGVSNSTISRLLKTNIPEAEYEVLIQQKRGVKGGGEDENLKTTDEPSNVTPTGILSVSEIDRGMNQPDSFRPNLQEAAPVTQLFVPDDLDLVGSSLPVSSIDDSSVSRRVRRRSSAPLASDEPIAVKTTPELSGAETTSTTSDIDPFTTDLSTLSPKTQLPPPTPVLREILSDSKDRYSPPPVVPAPLLEITIDELEEDPDPDDVNALAAMFGEEIADGDDDDETDTEDWDEDATSAYQQLDRDRLLTEDRLHIQVTPLSQATLPRTCYIVVDKFAELIVRPLKDFADLGQISGEEIQQRTLPIFDNHRVAKRFSNQRTQRVIKVPDSRVFHKTTQHLRSKGITRLLVDGNIYSLN
jgi:hypothetical protein